MSVRLVAVELEAADPVVAGGFWAGLLDRAVVEDPGGVLVPGDDAQVGLRFVRGTTARTEWNRLHLHVTSASEDDQRRIVDAVLRLGGRRRGTGPLPFGADLYLADPSGDEFCVIEPGNRFLDGCGPLAEVTCEGSPAAGRFWAAALDWPLVWDQDEQIAVQSPAGGTKLSWDGSARPDEPGWNRQRFVVAAPEPEREVDRLAGLGAGVVGGRDGVVLLTDPDGSAFTLERR